jgi:hypothetical protein
VGVLDSETRQVGTKKELCIWMPFLPFLVMNKMRKQIVSILSSGGKYLLYIADRFD